MPATLQGFLENMIKFMDLNNQFREIESELIPELHKAIESSSFIGGEHISLFENEFARYIGAKFCQGVANGTDALEIIIEALDLPKGSEILVPCNSFFASAECVLRQKYKLNHKDALQLLRMFFRL